MGYKNCVIIFVNTSTSINTHLKLTNHTPLKLTSRTHKPHSSREKYWTSLYSLFIPSPSTLPRASKCTLHKSQLIISYYKVSFNFHSNVFIRYCKTLKLFLEKIWEICNRDQEYSISVFFKKALHIHLINVVFFKLLIITYSKNHFTLWPSTQIHITAQKFHKTILTFTCNAFWHFLSYFLKKVLWYLTKFTS